MNAAMPARVFCLAWMAAAVLACVPATAEVKRGPGWIYDRQGNPHDIQTPTEGGIALEGGGRDVNEVYRWMCAKAHGGDFLVIRQTGTPAYNPYISRLCPSANSVATLKIRSKTGALDPFVARTILHAEALFIAGGDQAAYVAEWRGTPVQSAIDALARRGVPIGGTSAGNAVLAQFANSALHGEALSRLALANCYERVITISDDFLDLTRRLDATITDDHFVTRTRMGRLVTFLARIVKDGRAPEAFGIATNENTAFLMEPDGHGRVVGGSHAYFLRTPGRPEICRRETPVTFRDVSVYRIPAGGTFDVSQWVGQGGTAYSISAVRGQLRSTQAGGKIY
jgi:cyanophycinase-like exopeptidase